MSDNLKTLWGHMPPFNYKRDRWNVYKGRFEQFITVFKIEDDNQKKAPLLNFCGNDTYQFIYSLCCPSELSEIKHEELIKKLDDHFFDAVNVWIQRKRFFECVQEEGESCQDFVMKLRGMAMDCKFGQHMEDTILYKFVTGINNNKIFDELCDDTRNIDSIKKALDLSKKIENKLMVEKPSEIMAIKKYVGGRSDEQMSGKQNNDNDRRVTPRIGTQQSVDQQQKGVRCIHCGYNNHLSNYCRFKNVICRRCNVRGHMQKVCTKVGEEESNCILRSDEAALGEKVNIKKNVIIVMKNQG